MEKFIKDEDHHFPTPETSSDNTASSLSEPLSPFSSQSDHHSPAFFTTTPNEEMKKQKKKKLERKSASFAYRIGEHVRLGHKLSEMVKGKLSVGAKIMRKGGRGNLFRDIFGVSECEGEKLLKASQCYLSTTHGPIAGILFVSTKKIAFCSERSIATTLQSSSSASPSSVVKAPYKVCIPVNKIKGANQSENVNNPAQKYIQIVTHDNYEFWFMGFLRYEKAWINLQKSISFST
ncbi:GEM-like protein 6 [Salvia miltiorrhiza]|uniref:GEM-like protein 6 n=1 Tax=Salvia miltiorrhiza TaxID=226208 RepID=UPI0025AB9F69|nr:GEM-like protein 6 [Salvia miltiorrhiza]